MKYWDFTITVSVFPNFHVGPYLETNPDPRKIFAEGLFHIKTQLCTKM